VCKECNTGSILRTAERDHVLAAKELGRDQTMEVTKRKLT
jgi:hypothetical protein